MKGHTDEYHLYVHVPFCRKRCRYCDFYSTVGTGLYEAYTESVLKEIELVFQNERFSTIYLGGGTPSMLPLTYLEQIFKKIQTLATISEDAEITIEVNPDDVNEEKILAWKDLGINRVSVGVQSFIEDELQWLGRTHTAQQNFLALELLLKHFDNVSVDLIIHLPRSTQKDLKYNLKCIEQFDVAHLSVYGLTIEKGTSLYRAVQVKEFTPLNEELQREQLLFVYRNLEAMGFERYEVSNFAREGKFSKHNMAYWLGHPYIGLGPSAHSYKHPVRKANVNSLMRYIQHLKNEQRWYEEETITPEKHWMEMLMLRLRTRQGLSKKEVIEIFGERMWENLLKIIETKKLEGYFLKKSDTLSLTEEGILILDSLLSEIVF